MDQEIYTGYIYEKPKDKDYKIMMAVDGPTTIPDEYKDNFMLPYQPPVQKQLCGNCVAQSLANILEVMYYNYNNNSIDSDGKTNYFSIGFIYGNRGPRESHSEGMTGYQACDHLVEDGDVKSEIFDNPGSAPSIVTKVNEFKEEMPNWKDYSFIPPMYIRTESIHEIKWFILKYRIPVMGIVHMTGIGGTYLHAMPLYGWKDENIGIFQNSWGPNNRPVVEIDLKSKTFEDAWMILPFNDFRFKDLDESHWAYKNIINLVTDKIMCGYEDDTIKPDNNMTRAEFCSLIYRYLILNKRLEK